MKALVEGEDYVVEDGLLVFTAKYLQERGYCCKNGCRNCPYGYSTSPERSESPETGQD